MGKLLHFGCETNGWERTVEVSRPVRRAITQNPSLFLTLDRALKRHSHSIPPVLRFGKTHETLVWRERDPKWACVISTYCPRKGGLETLIGIQGVG